MIRAARRTNRKRRAPRLTSPWSAGMNNWARWSPWWTPPASGPSPPSLSSSVDAGFGKSRLLEELAVHARTNDRLVVLTSAEDDEVLPYRPFTDLVREVLGSPMAATFPLDDLGPLVADLVWLVPKAPGQMVPPVSDVGLARLRLFEAVVELVQAAVQHQDLALLVDDAHRMAHETAALLGLLLERAMNGPLVVVLAAQSEAAASSPAAFGELVKRHVPSGGSCGPLSRAQVEGALEAGRPRSGLAD